MPWVILFFAGIFEIIFASCLYKANSTTGQESLYWYGGFVTALGLSIALLMKATESLPIGTAYAVWTGMGAVGTVCIGIIFFKEPVTFFRMLFLLTLIGSIIGLKWASV